MSENLLEMKSGGLKFKNRVSNPRVFRAYMLAKAPVLGVTGAALEHIDTYGARLSLRFGRRTKSLFGTMFGAAVMAGAETTSGAMLVLHMRNQGSKLKVDLVDVHMTVVHNSAEDLTILCHEGERYAEFVQTVKASGRPATEVFEAHAVNAAGTVTHNFSLTWRLS